MDWIAAAEATRNTGYGERKKKRAFVADKSLEYSEVSIDTRVERPSTRTPDKSSKKEPG